MSSKENGRKGWFGVGAGASSWGPLGWMWSAWGGSGGAANGGGVRGDAEESIVAADEEVRMPFIFARVCLAQAFICLFSKVFGVLPMVGNVQGSHTHCALV